jgi:hypothetical protein
VTLSVESFKFRESAVTLSNADVALITHGSEGAPVPVTEIPDLNAVDGIS